MTTYEGLTKFLEENRQTGTTTALAAAAVDFDGYLIVGNLEQANYALKRNPLLRPDQVLTIGQIRSDHARGLQPRPVFIDPTAIWGVK